MMRLTIARYYTPVGRSIQKPYESMTLQSAGQKVAGESYETEIYERYQHGEMVNSDSINLNDSLRFDTKRLKRSVYGGGGIVPDYFVPIDTTQTTALHRQLVLKGVLFQAGVKYIELNREKLKTNYPTFDVFKSDFNVTDDLISLLKSLARDQKIKSSEEEFTHSIDKIEVQLKALIARDLWGVNEYFQIINDINPSLLKAIELLKKDSYKQILSSN